MLYPTSLRIFLALTPLVASLLLSGCGEDDAPAAPLLTEEQLAYFPLELGQPRFYRVDSIVLLNEVGGVRYDTATLEARETLVETFTDATGRQWYRGERYERPDANAPWRFRQTFTVSRDRSTALRREDNLTFTKLTFPLLEGRAWDGNAAFDDGQFFVLGGEFVAIYADWTYRYSAVGQPLTLRTGLELAASLRVDQASTDNLLDLRRAYEVYAPGRGRVERFIDARSTQCRNCCGGETTECLDLPWDVKAEKGFILHETLLP